MKSAQQYINEVRAEIDEISVENLHTLLSQTELILIDVREHEEFIAGHILGAVNFPRGVLENKLCDHPAVSHHCDSSLALDDLSQRNIYLICRSGGRSALAARSLENMGHSSVLSVAGGMIAWEKSQFPTVI
ncbi:rhodanese-like domain-containing protein [Aliiglaciecola sp. 3_MG-2023]|uniref:rhodanese-like domain-containing protein n=1 Tax=Aliiglaciecola sp. 3_MG-2023 TaxID=3062644 RepID=UPI0026E346A8|nr:rhodanese-like domain-containing protein [Aliiglaciecola sp. 3_MG-2023]MDO6695087.1 rhodanese-like domain-containing protein [Aliiglaciecola sp. 3_MG-2023]